jgi:hypothetical protein
MSSLKERSGVKRGGLVFCVRVFGVGQACARAWPVAALCRAGAMSGEAVPGSRTGPQARPPEAALQASLTRVPPGGGSERAGEGPAGWRCAVVAASASGVLRCGSAGWLQSSLRGFPAGGGRGHEAVRVRGQAGQSGGRPRRPGAGGRHLGEVPPGLRRQRHAAGAGAGAGRSRQRMRPSRSP